MHKRIGGIEQFEFDVLSPGSQMTVTIAISGWVGKGGYDGMASVYFPVCVTAYTRDAVIFYAIVTISCFEYC